MLIKSTTAITEYTVSGFPVTVVPTQLHLRACICVLVSIAWWWWKCPWQPRQQIFFLLLKKIQQRTNQHPMENMTTMTWQQRQKPSITAATTTLTRTTTASSHFWHIPVECPSHLLAASDLQHTITSALVIAICRPLSSRRNREKVNIGRTMKTVTTLKRIKRTITVTITTTMAMTEMTRAFIYVCTSGWCLLKSCSTPSGH